MATRIGVIKSISQGANVIATAKDGTQRVLKVGDEIFLGETIQTTDIDSKVVITANDGKDIAIIGKDTLNLDKSVAHNDSFGDDSVADVSAIQKALLDGANITDLEETAAGGNQGGNAGGDGVSLGAASFEEGGHYSNITDDYRNLPDSNRAFQTPENSIGGYNDGNDAGDATPVAPVIPPISVDIKTLTDDFGTITGDYSLDAPSVPRTNDATPTISGTVEPTAVRAVVSVLDKNGHEVFTKTLNPSDYTDGTFKFTTNQLAVDGDYKVEITATGRDGKTATDSGDFVLDTTAKITINVETEMSLVKESEMSEGLKGNFWFNHIYEPGVSGTELRPYAFNNTTYAHDGMKQNDFVEYYMNNTKPWASFKAKELNFQQGEGGDRDNLKTDPGAVSGLDGAHNRTDLAGARDLDGNLITPSSEWVAPNFKALEYFIDNAKGSDIKELRPAPIGTNTTAGAMVNLKGTMYLEPGDYKFDAKGTDDSVRFKVDGKTMVDYDTIHSENKATTTTLHVDKAGYYDFDMSYANYIFEGVLKLTVSKDGGKPTILGSEESGIKLNSTDFDSYVDTTTRNVYKVTQKITGTVSDVEDGQIVTVTSSTGESHTAKVVNGKYEVEFKTSDPKATYTAKVSDLVGNEAQAISTKLNVANTDLIDAIDNDASNVSANTNTGINDATKYYKYTIDDITQTDKFSSNAPLPVLSDKTPTFTGSIDSSATKAIITVLDKNGHEVFTKELSKSEFSNGKFEVTSDVLNDGKYNIKATAIFANGDKSTIVSEFVVDKTPVTIENIKIIEKDGEGLHHTLKFNLKNYEEGDKIESINMVKGNENINIVEFKIENGVLSFEYDHKIKLGDKIEVKMADKAGTKYTHVNEILVPTMTQFENGNDTTTNANNRSAEKIWGTMEMSESGTRADGSRIVSNDAIPYLRAVIPEDATAGNTSNNQTVSEFLNSGRGITWGTGDVRFVATNVDKGVSKELLSQSIEKPIGNVTPDHYNRLTGYNNRLDGAGKMADGVYDISIKGKYQGGDELLYNSIKFTIDATAATINNSNLSYDAATNKTTWSGNLSENGVGASYTLKQHFEEAVKGIALEDSITIKDAAGNPIVANSVKLDEDGKFEAVFNGEVKESDVYLQISDIAKNTRVVAENNNNNNVITTTEGNDIITVGDGNNTINAGRGENEIRTGNGNNVIITGDNNDVITTGSGNDYIDAGRSGYTGINKGDLVNAGAGNDKVVFTFDDPRAALSQSLDGGTGTDTLIMRPVAKDGTIDFDKIDNKSLTNAIKNFEEIQLGMDEHGNDNQAVKLLNLKADNVFSITDDVNTILKISGDSKDSVSLKGFTEATDQSGVQAGYTRYEGQTSSATPTTIYIDVDNDINKQLV